MPGQHDDQGVTMEQRRARILVVDDEQDLVWALQHALCAEGYEVLTAGDGVQALAVARRHRPDLVVLDIAMPVLNGLQVCQELRQDPAAPAIPILFLTVRSDVEQRVKGLDAGSDDYLVKPFDVRELKARIRALLRRARQTAQEKAGLGVEDSALVVGSLVLDGRSRQVRVGRKTVQLTPAEFHLLHYLMLHLGEVFSAEQLLQLVWGYLPAMAEVGLVRWHIKNLRAKIEADPAHPLYICNVPRHGYVLRSGTPSG
jgi:two-component system response regulator VicR